MFTVWSIPNLAKAAIHAELPLVMHLQNTLHTPFEMQMLISVQPAGNILNYLLKVPWGLERLACG